MAWTSEHNYDYDLVVIGAGSGGVRASRIAASHGAKVALLEPSMSHGPPNYSAVGGTCVNVGCVPKKLMVYGSHYSHDMQDAKSYGWNVPDGITLDWCAAVCGARGCRISSRTHSEGGPGSMPQGHCPPPSPMRTTYGPNRPRSAAFGVMNFVVPSFAGVLLWFGNASMWFV